MIRVDLDTRADMELAVYNMSGQQVATLARGLYPARDLFLRLGRTRNTRGLELASGVYICRLRADGQEQTRKLLLLR